MRNHRARAALTLFTVLGAAACGSSDVVRTPPKTQPKLTAIAVTPEGPMVARGEALTLAATGTYSDGTTKDITLLATWRSLNADVATIDAHGQVTTVSVGTAELRASLDDVFGATTVTVTPSPLASISVEPGATSVDWGKTTALVATAHFEDGTTTDVTGTVSWSSADPSIASVSGGTVTGVAAGVTTITARETASGKSAEATITVAAPRPTSIAIQPGMLELAVGRQQQLTATARYEDGTDHDVTATVRWGSTNATSATVGDAAGSKGLVTAVTEGIGSITAVDEASGVRAAVTVRVVSAVIDRLEITPAGATIGRGATQGFRATAHFSNGTTRDLTNAAMWSSSDTSVATLATGPGQRGIFLGVGAGTATISARDPTSGVGTDDDGSSVRLTVTAPTLRSVTVLPLTVSLALGLTRSFQAYGIYSDGSSVEITNQVMWQSSNASVATVDPAGLLTTTGQGVATISAIEPTTGLSSDASMRSGQVTVTPPELLRIQLSPTARAMIVGTSQRFTARGFYTDGHDADISSSVQWQSSGPAVTVDATGLATAVEDGMVTISATEPTSHVSSDASNGSAQVTVSAATLLSITVTPTSTTVPVGAELPLVAMGYYDNGATADLTNVVTWSSSAPGTVEVSNDAGSRGVAIGRAAGAAVVSALEPLTGVTSETNAQSAAIAVDGAPALVSLAVSPRTAHVDVNRTRAFRALGTYSNGHVYTVTNAVTWSSSSPARATVSNAPGSRGVVTGVTVGTAQIAALYAPTSISSDASGQSAALTIDLGIVTLSGTWPGPTVSIDGTPDYSVDVGSVVLSPASFPPAAVISHVAVSIDFLKTDGSCAAPQSGGAYHNETNFRLQAPSGATVILAPPNTWSGGTAISPVTVVFDQTASAVPSGTPVSGTFRPNGGDLSTLNGLAPGGTWILQAGDAGGGDPLCVNAYTITVTAQ